MKENVVLIFGGSGAIGRSVAHRLAQEGAQIFVAARHREKLDSLVENLRAAGGKAEAVVVDVLDEQDTFNQVANLARQTGGIDIVVNATGFMHQQGKHIEALTLAEFRQGFDPFLTAQFTIAKAVTPHMGGERSGCILSVVAPAARMAMAGHAGHIVGCAGIEAFTKALASELGPRNIRVLCLRSHAIVDAVQAGSYVQEIFEPKAQALGVTVDEWLGGAAQSTMLKRLPDLAEVAEVVSFLVSERARSMTATTVNLTAGATTD